MITVTRTHFFSRPIVKKILPFYLVTFVRHPKKGPQLPRCVEQVLKSSERCPSAQRDREVGKWLYQSARDWYTPPASPDVRGSTLDSGAVDQSSVQLRPNMGLESDPLMISNHQQTWEFQRTENRIIYLGSGQQLVLFCLAALLSGQVRCQNLHCDEWHLVVQRSRGSLSNSRFTWQLFDRIKES